METKRIRNYEMNGNDRIGNWFDRQAERERVPANNLLKVIMVWDKNITTIYYCT